MSQTPLSCAKCKSEMELGHDLGGTWVRGLPKIPRLVKLVSWNLFKLPGENEYVPVGTYRCKSCGFLESYARDEFASQ